MLSVCLYLPNNPEFLTQMLERALKDPNKNEILVWVDNDDHKTSSEFYTLRRFIKKGLNVKVFVNPKAANEQSVFEFLESQATNEKKFRFGITEGMILFGFLGKEMLNI